MGEYASWANRRLRRSAAARSLVRRAIQRLGRHARGVSQTLLGRHHEAVFGKPLKSVSLNVDWFAKARFLDSAIEREQLSSPHGARRKPRIVHLIGSLQPGGAERQLCNCVIGTSRLGYDVSVWLLFKPTGEHDHYGEILAHEGIPVRVVGEDFNPGFESALEILPGGAASLKDIPEEFCPFAIDILGELLSDPPDVFHSWLDHPNIWGGVAALIANVPVIVLSTRNVNPMHFPYLASPYFSEMYKQLTRSRRVKFINNSHAGAADYANWLSIPKSTLSVVLNGVDFSGLSRRSEEEARALREELGVPLDARVIAGVFRLSEEKQPLVFLEVVRRIVERHADVFALIAGIGPLEQQVKDLIVRHGLGGRVLLLGRRTDVSNIYLTATLKLLCSLQEGTPNVLLEAQWSGCPVVSTKAGGAVDAVSHEETGLLVDVGDINGLECAVRRILESPDLRSRMAKAGPAFIQERFGMDRMIRDTVAVYNLPDEWIR